MGKKRSRFPLKRILTLAGCTALYFLLRGTHGVLSVLSLTGAGISALSVLPALRKPKVTVPTEKEQLNAALSRGRGALIELRRQTSRIKDPQMRSLSSEICDSADKILRTLRTQPRNLSSVRQFFNYYLPTLKGILTKYVRVEESGVNGEDMKKNAVACLGDIRVAMDKQYASLFDGELLDLSVEMEALTLACKRDGLLTEEELQLKDGDQSITLSL